MFESLNYPALRSLAAALVLASRALDTMPPGHPSAGERAEAVAVWRKVHALVVEAVAHPRAAEP